MNTAKEDKIIYINHLTKSFDGVRALDGLSFGITGGEIVGVVGPNGSGKTTLINSITGLIEFDNGTVSFGGQDADKIYSFDMPTFGVSRTFQQIRLFGQMSVIDNVLVVLTEKTVFQSMFERHTKFHLEKAEEVLKMVGMWEKRSAKAEDLSYGQRKLLEIARVLAVNPEVVLLDEPFAGLFPEVVKKVESIIEHLKVVGKTVVLIEHNMDIIRRLCDRSIVMDAGKLLADGRPADVLVRRDVVEAYLGE